MKSSLYPTLTAHERHRLMLAAHYRGDTSEFHRLRECCQQATCTAPDYSFFAEGFQTICLQQYISLLGEASNYHDACSSAALANDAYQAQPDSDHDICGEFWLELAHAYGYRLQTKVQAWQRFCDRLQIPPMQLWEHFPGFNQMRTALDRLKHIAFTPEQMVHWLNTHRPIDTPAITEMPMNVENVYAALRQSFQQRCVR